MRYAVIHCRNPKCLLKVWVPAPQLGRQGRCPQCGAPLQVPGDVPPDEMTEGPAIIQIQEDNGRELSLAETV